MEKFDIEAYLDGALNQAERTEFEAEMNNNPAFAQEVRLMQQLTGDVQMQLLREQVNGALRDGGGSAKNRSIWFGLLGILLLLCAGGYFFIYSTKNTPATSGAQGPQTPAQQQTEPARPGPEPANPNERAPEKPPTKKPPAKKQPIAGNLAPLPDRRIRSSFIRGTNAEDQALAALLDNIWYMDFPPSGARFAAPYDEPARLLQVRDSAALAQAYIRLELLERSSPANDTLRFLKGYCLLELGQGRGALPYFEPAGDDAWTGYRQWYRALSLLLAGRRDEAAAALEAIRDSRRHPFRRQSAKALELMK